MLTTFEPRCFLVHSFKKPSIPTVRRISPIQHLNTMASNKKARTDPAYELLYWPGIPGRGEFIRLAFEAAGVPYKDTANEVEDGTYRASSEQPTHHLLPTASSP